MRSDTSKRWASSLALIGLLVSCSRATKPLHGTHEDLPGGNVLQMKLMTATSGWALTDRRFVSTTDAGKTWADLTPIDAPGNTLRAGFFLNDSDAWCAALRGGKIDVYRSTNKGHSWEKTTLAGDYQDGVGSVTIDFVDATHGWIDVERVHGSSFDTADLYRTTNRGESWEQLPLPNGEGSRMSFTSRSVGFIVSGATGAHLSRTTDSGSSWQEIKFPQSVRCTASAAGCAPYARPTFDPPLFSDESHGVLKETFTAGTLGIRVMRTEDAGATWTTTDDDLNACLSAATVAIALLGNGVLALGGGRICESVGGAGSERPTLGLPDDVAESSFTGLEAWAISHISPCTGSCASLYASRDSGATWTKLNP